MKSAIALAAALLVLPAFAEAQQPTDTVELAPVVITPSRRPTGLGRVTQATTVITGDELRTRGIQFVADALRGVTLAQMLVPPPAAPATPRRRIAASLAAA
jgi:outer membrane cobalamin receptor